MKKNPPYTKSFIRTLLIRRRLQDETYGAYIPANDTSGYKLLCIVMVFNSFEILF
jgi:hypothetical protein